MTDMSQQIKAQIDEVLADTNRLPSMPGVVNKAISMANDPDVDIKALADEITHDPGITAGIIKLSNSAYFRPAQKVRSVHEAIMTLGLKIVQHMIVITASKGVLNQPIDSYKLDAGVLWDHSLLVAEICSRIAGMKKTKTPGDVAFTAGLFHDVGKVVLSNFFKRVQMQVNMEMVKNPESRFTDLEQKFMGYDHTNLGGELLKRWKFPDELIEAVALHYHPEKATINPELVSIVHLANFVALASGIGIDIGGLNEDLSKFALDTLKIQDKELEMLYDRLPDILQELDDMRSL